MAPSESESPLPDDYLPRHRDSALALVRPESSFLEFFKQSLLYTSRYCTDPNCCTFFESPATSSRIIGQADVTSASHVSDDDMINGEMPYPLVLFEDLREIPPAAVLLDLALQGQVNFTRSVPFLSRISCIKLDQNHVPFYLLLPEALLGSSSLKECDDPVSTGILWRACVSLITGTVEVDNSIGRSLVWHTAAILIVTFGVMQTNEDVWRQAEIVSGYVQSTLYRPGFIIDPTTKINTDMTSQNTSIPNESIHMLRGFYFIIDTLRSIHFHTPSTVDSAWSIRVGLRGEYDFKAICDALVLDKCPPPSKLSSEEHLLILTSILSDTNTLLCMLGPLTGICTHVHGQIERASQRAHTTHQSSTTTYDSITTPLPTTDSLNEDYYPPIPFTADYEYARLRNQIAESLELWGSSFRSGSTPMRNDHGIKDSTIVSLFHLCRLLLECGPTLYITASLAGYMPHGYDTLSSSLPRPCQPHTIGIHFSDSALQISMDILEAVETASCSDPNELQQYCPMWYPLALFYGALVAWGSWNEEKTKQRAGLSSRYNQFTSFRLLQIFHGELVKLSNHWGCAKQMALTIAILMQ